jgi:hypothetical protein
MKLNIFIYPFFIIFLIAFLFKYFNLETGNYILFSFSVGLGLSISSFYLNKKIMTSIIVGLFFIISYIISYNILNYVML